MIKKEDLPEGVVNYVQTGATVAIAVNYLEYQGNKLLDIRKIMKGANGKWTSTPKGIAMQWSHAGEIIDLAKRVLDEGMPKPPSTLREAILEVFVTWDYGDGLRLDELKRRVPLIYLAEVAAEVAKLMQEGIIYHDSGYYRRV